MKRLSPILLLLVATMPLSGCWLALAGVGAEAGYVVAQDDRTAKETLKDQYLVTAVKAALLADSKVPGLDINVDAFKGVITLRGALTSAGQIERAVDVASTVDGVVDVKSKLAVVE